MIGQMISHYKILEKLGEGGMGIVYKAHDTKLDRTVALKFLPRQVTVTNENKQRFVREAKSAAMLNHPHICTIHSVDEHDGNQFIVMEYVDGLTLRQTMKSSLLEKGGLQGGLSIDTALSFSIQIAEALSEAHENGIIHRDIKPDNIMVTSKDRIKVMDFGLAKLKGSVDVTRAGTTVGTVKYMAPEQMQGDDIDHRSDIWSFGVVLYEIISGGPPFQAEYESALIYQIINDAPPQIREHRPDIPEKLAHIIHRMIGKSPDDRYDSLKSVINDLRNITGRDEDAWLSGGIAETVTVDLAKVSSLRVVSRERILATLAKYKDPVDNDNRVIEVGLRLKVRWIVWGAYQKMGNRIRITAQFVDVPSGNLINSTKVDGTMDDIFDLQDTIILNLRETLNVKIPTTELRKI